MSQPTDPRHFKIKHDLAEVLKNKGYSARAASDERKGKNSKSNIYGRQIKYLDVDHRNTKLIAALNKALEPYNCVIGIVDNTPPVRVCCYSYGGPYLQVQRGKDFQV